MRWIKYFAIFALSFVLFCVVSFSFFHWYRPKVIKPSRTLEKKITSFQVEDPRWTVPCGPEMVDQLNHIFSQHFYFIGQGRQCTAYVSYDGQYVIKFLLQKPLVVKERFLDIPDVFPFTLFKQYKVDMRETRKKNLFTAFMTSYYTAPEETGTIYVHLNTTDNLFKKPMIVDTKGNPVVIDPDTTQFVIQKRAHHVKPVIIDLMQEGRVDEAKSRVTQVLMLLYDSAKKGVIDVDPGLIRNDNIGFLDSSAIYIDTGKLRLVKEGVNKKGFIKDLKRLKPFDRWLQAYYPELAEHYAAKEQELINSY